MAVRQGSGAEPPLLALVGPTASGKTEAGDRRRRTPRRRDRARSTRCCVYRGMDVGTAKPTAEQRARVPHHLLDVAEPSEPFTVARYQGLAREAVDRVRSRGRRVLLVGGSGLYFRAVVDDLEFPGTDPVDPQGSGGARPRSSGRPACTSASPRPTPSRPRRSSRGTSGAPCGRSRSPRSPAGRSRASPRPGSVYEPGRVRAAGVSMAAPVLADAGSRIASPRCSNAGGSTRSEDWSSAGSAAGSLRPRPSGTLSWPVTSPASSRSTRRSRAR